MFQNKFASEKVTVGAVAYAASIPVMDIGRALWPEITAALSEVSLDAIQWLLVVSIMWCKKEMTARHTQETNGSAETDNKG